MTGYSFSFWSAQIAIRWKGQKLYNNLTKHFIETHHYTSDSAVYTARWADVMTDFWTEDTHFVLGQSQQQLQ